AIAAVIAAPGDYGADRIFTYMEPFLTPRMAAESLVLASLAAALRERRTLAVALIATAALLHPLMATPGIAALLYRLAAVRKPLLAAAVVIVGLKAVVLTALALPEGPWGRFDANWLAAVERRSPYLFLGGWHADDWARAALPLATLAVGSIVLRDRARALAQLGLWIGIAGLALTFIGCDALHVVRLTQLQPWRCLWLGALVAALLLPLTLHTLWNTDRPARSTALLLIAGWVFAGNLYGLAAVSLAALSLLLPNRLRASEARWVYYGAAGLLAIAVAWRLASNMQFTDAHYFDPHIPLWIRRTMSFTRDGTIPTTVITAAWVLARRRGGKWPLLGVGALGALLCVLLMPYTWGRWTDNEFPAARIEQFAAFRQEVPPGEDVFWPELPIGAWVLLDRPSYLSVIQTSGLVFSQESARELRRRADALSAVIDPRAFLEFDGGGAAMTLTPQQLNRVCESGAVHYLVSGADLAEKPVADVAPAAGSHAKPLHLYRCHPGAGQTRAAAAT
ncbi:MAG: hypothetical protein M3O06_01630, partial [Pseudomonadota bacterium]|nr:hypothetical protein [Pseudomonadota bacterium]